MQFLNGFEPALLLGYLVTFITLNFTPGPAILKVVGDSMTNGVARTHGTMAGVFAANMMYALIAISGMGVLITAFPVVFTSVKWIGVAYLAYLAVVSARSALTSNCSIACPRQQSSARRLFWSAFFVQAANPKSVLSFCIMLPAFAGEGEGIELRMLTLALLNIALEYPAMLFYAVLGNKAARFAVSARAQAITHWISASALGAAALMISRSSVKSQG